MQLLSKTGLSLSVLCLASAALAQETPPAGPPPSAYTWTSAKTESSNGPVDEAQKVTLPPFLGIDIRLAGYFWADIGYMARSNTAAGQYDENISYLQGRYVLGAEFSRPFGNYYAAAKVEFLGLVNEFAQGAYEPHTLDAYLRVGHNRWWDVQVGRFLAWEVYYRGQGIELYTAEEAGVKGGAPLYWLNLARGYINGGGQVAVHVYPTDWLKFEVSSVYGQQNGQNLLGVRPAMHLTVKDFQFLAGFEYLSAGPQTDADKTKTTSMGYAGRAQYTFFKVVTAGAEFAQEFVDATDIRSDKDTQKSLVSYTVGGFIDVDFWKNSIGLGYHRTNQLDDRHEFNRHDQAFVTYQYRLPIPGLSAKLVYGYAHAYIESADKTPKATWDNNMHSFRLRISYEFN
jgi:hypothetical protein